MCQGPSLRECRLQVQDRETGYCFLVDSGSIVSLILRNYCRGQADLTNFELSAANGSSIRTYGQKMVVLNLGLRRDIRWPFIIADIYAPIIGADLLRHYGLIIDLKECTLYDSLTALAVRGSLCSVSVHGVTVPIQVNSSGDPEGVAYAGLVQAYADITRPKMMVVPDVDTPVAHCIVTTGPPVYERPRRLLGAKLKAARKHFNHLLQQGVIRPSNSQWSTPLHMVPKSRPLPAEIKKEDPDEEEWRITGDYRGLNALTRADRYPLPRPEDIFQDLQGARVFSVVDFKRAYHQIPVAPEDIEKTALTTSFDLFEFLGMPPGLKNGAQTLQRHMDTILRGLSFVRCYLNDLIIAAASHEDHVEHLRAVFNILRRHNLTVNMDKCFWKSEVTYLGYVVDKHGCRPPVDRIEAISTFPKPVTISELRRFLGMLNYYRHSIAHAADMQAPLNQYLKKARKRTRPGYRGPPQLRRHSRSAKTV